jgi:hypothetical protein
VVLSGNARDQRIATPQGSVPTPMSCSLTARSVSIPETYPEGPQATYSFLPSAVSAMFQGR